MASLTLRFRVTNKDIFKSIESGKKKVETRAATIKYKNISKGDEINFLCGKEKFSKQVRSVKIYKSLKSLLKKYKPQDITPWVKDAKELEAMYYSFPGYKEKIKKSGIIALEVK